MLDFFINILKTPAIIIGIVALVGLILQGKNAGEVFSGTVKTAIGLLIIIAGAGFIVKEILPFVFLFSKVFHLQGFATTSEAVVGSMQNTIPVIATSSSLILGIGFLVNIIIARISPLKFIFLTGHMMWILSVTIAATMYEAHFSLITSVVIGSILQGMIMVILPTIAQPYTRRVIGGDYFGIAHLTTLGTVPAAFIGGLLGNKARSAEDIKLPESLEFFKDTSVSVSIVMGVFYLIVVLLAGPTGVHTIVPESAGTNYIIYGILKALGFTAGILVLLQGVRLFLGEIVPAFKGISDRLVPGCIPALDVPVLFPYAPNSLMIGFVTAVVGMLVGMGLSTWLFGVVPLVSIIGAFFTGGVAGIYGNATGGLRGAVIAGFLYGLALILGSGFIFKIFDYSMFGAKGVGYDTIDAMVYIAIMRNTYVGIGIVVAAFVILSLLMVNYNRKVARAKAAEEATAKDGE